MTDAPVATPRDVLGAGAGGPLSPPTPWIQYTGYLQYSGGVVVGNPTGGNLGAGIVNASGVYANGVSVLPNSYVKLAGGIMTGILTLSADPVNPLDSVTKEYADTKVPLAGGTMTGPLLQAADPVNNLGTATKQYVDNKAALYLPLTGGVLTGLLTLSADPTSPLHAADKRYVDNQISTLTGAITAQYLPLSGGTLTGPLLLNADPTTGLGAATKTYVDTRASGFTIPDAPSDGSTYGRNNAAWTNVIDAGTY